MNPGRAPTRIGGDGILPFLDVPHWLTVDVIRILRSHRVEYRVRSGYIHRQDSEDPDDQIDRLTFPSTHADQIQALLDPLRPPGCG